MSLTTHPEQRGWMLARLFVMAAVVAFGGLLWVACSPQLPASCRILYALGALIALALPLRVLYVGARRFYRTGRWSISPEEKAQWLQRLAARPERPWVLPATTGVLMSIAVLNVAMAATRNHRHGLTLWNALGTAFWLLFLAGQVRTLWKELYPRRATQQELDTPASIRAVD